MEKIFFYNVGNIAKTIFPEFQRKYLKCADPCGQHVEIGIFDSVISTFFIKSKTTGYACGSKELIAMRRKKPPFVTIELVCQPEK